MLVFVGRNEKSKIRPIKTWVQINNSPGCLTHRSQELIFEVSVWFPVAYFTRMAEVMVCVYGVCLGGGVLSLLDPLHHEWVCP